jgi:hypothetical protein
MKSPNYQSAEYRPITIKTTDGSTIHGKVNLAYKQRVANNKSTLSLLPE